MLIASIPTMLADAMLLKFCIRSDCVMILSQRPVVSFSYSDFPKKRKENTVIRFR